MGKWVTAGIIVFWLAMMTWLVQREVVPAIVEARAEAQSSGSYKELLEGGGAPRPRKVTMGIFRARRRIGETTTTIKPEEHSTWDIRTATEIEPKFLVTAFPLLSRYAAMIPGELDITTDAVVGADYSLMSFNAVVKSSAILSPWVTVNGVVVGNKITVTMKDASGNERTLPPMQFDPQHNLSSLFTTPLAPGDLYVGRRWRIEMVNPITGEIETAFAAVTGREVMTVRGLDQDVYVVEVNYRGFKLKSWATQTGEVIKQEAPFGLTLIREDLLPSPTKESQNPKGKAPSPSHD